MRANLGEIDQSSPDSKGVVVFEYEIVDAFDKQELQFLLPQIQLLVGNELVDGRLEPRERSEYRGGPYLHGATHRRVWAIHWGKMAFPRENFSAADLAQLRMQTAYLIVQWSDYLPFVVVVARLEGQTANRMLFGRACEEVLAQLPGRLGPSNIIPRTTAQAMVYAKISDSELKTILKRVASRVDSKDIRTVLAGALPILGDVPGKTRIWAPGFGNLFLLETAGSGYLGGELGPSRAFVFSSGNIGPHKGWTWHFPMWIPGRLGTSTASDFNFHPFLIGAIRNAIDIGIQAGPIDEALANLTTKLQTIAAEHPRSRAKSLAVLHEELIKMQAKTQLLHTRLHLGLTRATVSEHVETWGEEIVGVLPGFAARHFPWTGADTPRLLEVKTSSEQEAKSVLDGLTARIQRVLDVVSNDRNWLATQTMMRWTIASGLLAAVAIAVSLVARGS